MKPAKKTTPKSPPTIFIKFELTGNYAIIARILADITGVRWGGAVCSVQAIDKGIYYFACHELPIKVTYDNLDARIDEASGTRRTILEELSRDPYLILIDAKTKKESIGDWCEYLLYHLRDQLTSVGATLGNGIDSTPGTDANTNNYRAIISAIKPVESHDRWHSQLPVIYRYWGARSVDIGRELETLLDQGKFAHYMIPKPSIVTDDTWNEWWEKAETTADKINIDPRLLFIQI